MTAMAIMARAMVMLIPIVTATATAYRTVMTATATMTACRITPTAALMIPIATKRHLLEKKGPVKTGPFSLDLVLDRAPSGRSPKLAAFVARNGPLDHF